MKLALLAATTLLLGGCLVRTRPGQHSQHGQHSSGHPAKDAHSHCHDRGGKHHKQVCHDHPHGPGHH